MRSLAFPYLSSTYIHVCFRNEGDGSVCAAFGLRVRRLRLVIKLSPQRHMMST